MAAVIGALRVDLDLGTAGWDAGLKRVQAQAQNIGAKFKGIGQGLQQTGLLMSAGITAPFTALVAKSIPAARESREALGQVEAAQKSMGNAAGFSTEQLQAQAKALQSMSTFDDDDILRKVTANMLTFGNVAGEQFERAQRAAVDLSARMGTDLQGAALMLGKALNDPAKGLAALRRVGIQFTKDQQEQIKAMAAAGDAAGAQRVMLAELERQFGGSAQALRNATPGADTTDQWREFQETVGELALNVLPPLTELLTGVLSAFNGLDPAMQSVAVGAVAVLAALGPILMPLGMLVSGIGSLIPLVAGWAASLGTAATAAGGFLPMLVPLLPVIAGIAAAAGAAYLAWKNWDTIGPMIADFGNAVVDALGPSVVNMLSALKEAAIALWNSAFVQALGKALVELTKFQLLILESLGSAIPGVLQAVGAVFRTVFDGIAAVIRLVVAILTGDWAGAWKAAGDLVRVFVDGVIGVFGGLGRAVIDAVSNLVRGIDQWMDGRLSATWNKVKAKVEEVKGYFRDLYDAVVGHSYVPDMVSGIAAEMARLDGALAEPAKKATAKATQAFRDMASQVQPLLDQLFPDEAKWLELQRNIDLVRKAGKAGAISPDTARRAEEELQRRHFPESEISVVEEGSEPLDVFKGGIEETMAKLPELGDVAQDTTARMIEAFAGMAQNVLGSLRGMVAAFKGGDILGGLQGLLDVVLQVVSVISGTGGFGGGGSMSGIGGILGLFGGGRALGGPVIPGRRYRVGERGPEWFTPTHRGRIDPGGAGPAAGNTYNFQGNLLTPEFWAEIQRMDEIAALRGTHGGAALAMSRAGRRAERRVA